MKTRKLRYVSICLCAALITGCVNDPIIKGNGGASDETGLSPVVKEAITVSTDFTDETKKDIELYNVWSVANRISPEGDPGVKDGLSVNLIRFLGGILKNQAPYYDYDVVTYNNSTQEYEYDFSPLFSRLDAVVKSNVPIHQIVLDQPDWAFQHGYTFITDGTTDNVNFREKERQSIYGNSLPPCDKDAYFAFIQELMRKLVYRYGESTVLSWNFRIGSEIETPDHWYGSKQDFIDHYINMTNAIRSVLPTAKIGPHTRNYDFVYSNKDYRNYKGEQVKSFTKDLLAQCAEQGITYDFWGVSDYMSMLNEDSRDIPNKFENFFCQFFNDPNWNPSAKMDIMEYSAIVNMGLGVSGYINCVTSHATAMEVCLTHQFYKHSDRLGYIYAWGYRPTSTVPTHISIINTMNGKRNYTVDVTGTPKNEGDYIDAIMATSETGFDVLVYNYNPKSLEFAENDEVVNISMKTNLPPNTVLKYREFSVTPKNNKLDCFRAENDITPYIRTDNQTYAKLQGLGNPTDCFTSDGLNVYNAYPTPAPYDMSEWSEIRTIACEDDPNKSLIQFSTTLPSFSLKKYDFRK